MALTYGGMTAGPSATGGLFVCVYNDQQHFSYLDASGNIQDAWYGTDGWHLQKINNGGMTAGPSAVGDLFVCVYNDQQHFSYRDKRGSIQDAWYGTDGWHLQQLTEPPADVRGEYVIPTPGPLSVGDLAVSVYNDQQHFAYRDASGNIQDAWYGTDGWHLQKINNGGMTAGPSAVGDLFVCVYNDQQHFSYRDKRGSIQDAWYGTDGWHLQQLTEPPADVRGEYVIPTPGPLSVGDLAVSVYNDQQHFAYRDASGNIQDVWYGTDGWHLQKINNGGMTAGPSAVGDLFVCVYNDQQHFSYRDKRGSIQDAWYGTDGWHLQQLTEPPADVRGEYVIPTPGPLSVGDLAVSVYNDQQHFAYRDASGNIQDVWYGTDGWHLQKINNGATWVPLSHSPGNYASAMWLMGDGTVLANMHNSTQLMALHPDAEGSYSNGSWTPNGNFLLNKWAFSSAVLPDGRLVSCGGEYSGPGLNNTETNFCEIYNPTTQSSTQFAPPPGWTNIGDSPTAVLPNGTMMIGNTQGKGNQVALLDVSNLSWTFGVGDADNEQGYTLMQNGDVLTAGVYNTTCKRYDPSANAFVLDASLPVMLGAPDKTDPGSEIGPGLSLMDGRVIWFGASGHTCIYTPGPEGHNGRWIQGPDLPVMPNGDQLVASDVSANIEPNGMVFLVVSGSKTPTTFVEYDPVSNAFSMVSGAPAAGDNEYCRTLLLPNGHGLVSTSNGTWYDVQFREGGEASWAPKITSFPRSAAINTTVTLAGTQLCGLSECQSYGDDNQQAENYPTVRLIGADGKVTYLRAHGVSTRSISPGQSGTVGVDIPGNLPLGEYSVEVVAMGIPSSSKVAVDVR